jgi:hypothetical protein
MEPRKKKRVVDGVPEKGSSFPFRRRGLAGRILVAERLDGDAGAKRELIVDPPLIADGSPRIDKKASGMRVAPCWSATLFLISFGMGNLRPLIRAKASISVIVSCRFESKPIRGTRWKQFFCQHLCSSARTAWPKKSSIEPT